MLRYVVSALALLSLAPLPALAGSACDHPHNDFDGLYCLNKVYQDSDAQLNQWFGRVRAKLDASGQAALRSSQLDWMRDRNDRCSRKEGSQFFVNLGCATQMTVQRTEVLEDHYRACLASSCSWDNTK